MARRVKEIPLAFLAGEDVKLVKTKINDTLKMFESGGYQVVGLQFRVVGGKKVVKRRTRKAPPISEAASGGGEV